MQHQELITYALIALFAPLVGFLSSIFLGKKVKSIFMVEIAFIIVAFISSVMILFIKLTVIPLENISKVFQWISVNDSVLKGFKVINIGILIDNPAAIMLVVVNFISLLVHLYSISYMSGDKRFNRYFSYLGLFTFSMLGIVLADNLLLMYISWELVGLSSYLLIGFWYEKDSAANASKKAFLANRIGDTGMFIGILLVFFTYNSFSFQEIFAQISQGKLPMQSEFWLTMTGIFLFCGAIGKSAQFPLHVWLPDAMEGPTPVSALIHAATMVAAGVFMVGRIFPLLTADAFTFIAYTGMLSAFIPATIALRQTDLKKVLAYSTISQLGFMVMGLGLGSYQFGLMHLVTHAFFKAGLFLGAGSVIHALHTQEMDELGGLRKKMPITYFSFLMFSIALCGAPLTSGFLSKDGILLATIVHGNFTGNYIFTIVGYLVTFMTAFYTFRLFIKTFHGETAKKPEKHHENHHSDDHSHSHGYEHSKLITVPLILLAILSTFIVFSFNPIEAESGWILHTGLKAPQSVVPNSSKLPIFAQEEKIEKSILEGTKSEHKSIKEEGKSEAKNEAYKAGVLESPEVYKKEYEESMKHNAHLSIFLSLFFSGLGVLLSFTVYQWKKIRINIRGNVVLNGIHTFLFNKWYFDELYDFLFVQRLLNISNFLSSFDKYVIDGFVNFTGYFTKVISEISALFDTYVVDGLVNFSAFLAGFVGTGFKKLQTGKVQSYLVIMFFCLILLIIIFGKI